MPGNVYEFNIYPNLRCPSIVQARIRLKSKSQNFGNSAPPKYPIEAQFYEQPLYPNPGYAELNTYNHRRPVGLKPILNNNEPYRYRHQNQSLDFMDQSFNQSSHGLNPNEYPRHYQDPQVSTHKIYVQSMTPPQSSQQKRDEMPTRPKSQCDDLNYSSMDPVKSYSTFPPSLTHSERDKQRVSYQAEFTVKGPPPPPRNTTPGHSLGAYSSSQMAKSYSSIPTDSSVPSACLNHSTANIRIYQTPMTKSYSTFYSPPDEPKAYYQNYQEYDDYQDSASNHDLYNSSAQMARSYSAMPSTPDPYQTYQNAYQSPNPFTSPMAKSYSNFSQPVTPLFDASSILRCYSSAAIMQPAPMPHMQPMAPMPPVTPMPSMNPYESIQMCFQDPCMSMPMFAPPCPPPPPCQPPPSLQKYEFADFQPDLCCIGRHLRRLRDRYRQQFVVPIVQ